MGTTNRASYRCLRPYIASARAGSEVIIVGNTYHLGEQENFLITKYNTSGTLLWQKEYNSLTGDRDFGMDVYIKGSYVYVTGFSWDSVANDADIVTLKLTLDSGNLVWSAIYAGSWGGYDAAAGLVVDNSGNVYVAGTEQKGTLDFKMTILKYNSSGTQQWVAHYDSSGYYDGAVAIYLNSTGTRLSATGFSGSAFTNWDFVTLGINMSTGAIGTIARNANPNGGISKPVALTQDFDGNWYVLGATALSPTNSDIKLIKYDTLFNEVWVRTFGSADSLADEPAALTVNPHHRLCITGFTSRSNGATNMLTLAYDKNGNLLWHRSISSTDPSRDAKGRDIKAEATFDGHLYVTGKLDKGSDHDYVTASYTQDGDLRWLKMFDDTTGSDDKAIDIALDAANNPIVSGICVRDTNTKYASVKYEQWTFENVPVTDTSNTPLYIANQLIVRFDPAVINTAFIDDREKTYSTLGNVITDTTLLSVLGAKLNGNRLVYDWKIRKVYRHATTYDTISITRLGDTIRLPKLWSTFVIHLPPDATTYNEEQEAVDSLRTIFPNVLYAHKNWTGAKDASPNDTYYASPNFMQPSLVATTSYPDGNINVEPAWDYETGKSHIRVGIFDDVVDWTHQDFGYTDAADPSTSLVKKLVYLVGQEIDLTGTLASFDFHATCSAGIIGALTHNNMGIAGIAGGWGGNQGVSLYSLDVFDNNSLLLDLPAVLNGTYYSSLDQPNSHPIYEYSLHAINNTWYILDNATSMQDIKSLKEAIYWGPYRHSVLYTASRGSFNFPFVDVQYPSCITEDDWITCVAGSNYDGLPATSSKAGLTVDLSAPYGSQNTVHTTSVGNNYDYFDGTSASTPHVTGVGALLLSHINQPTPHYNNLSTEDVQQILKLTANNFGSYYNYPDYGYGIVDAGAAIDFVRNNRIAHFGTTSGFSFSVQSGYPSVEPDVILYLNEPYIQEYGGSVVLGEESYKADVYEYKYLFDTDLQFSDFINYLWVRNSSSDLFGDYTTGIDPYPHMFISNIDQSNPLITRVEVTGYIYKVKSYADNSPLPNNGIVWLPFDDTEASWRSQVSNATLR